MSFKAWLNYPDYYFYWTYDGKNNSVFNAMNYVNPKMDEQIALARFETDPAKYEAQVKSFIQTAFDDVPRIPLVQDYRDVAMQPSIEGYTYWFHLTLDYRTLSRAPCRNGRRGTYPRRDLLKSPRGHMLTPAELSLLEAKTIAALSPRANLGGRGDRSRTRGHRADGPGRCTHSPRLRATGARSRPGHREGLTRGEPVGPLAGVPVPVKDLVLTKGMRTTFGSQLYVDFVPDRDDIAVERLRAAGAIIIGKTNAAEFGYGGVGHNPRLSHHQESVEPGAHAGRLERRLGRGGRHRYRADGHRQRWRRFDPFPRHPSPVCSA